MKFAIEPPAKADGLGYSPRDDTWYATAVAEMSILAVLQHDRLLLTWPLQGAGDRKVCLPLHTRSMALQSL